MLLAGLSSIVSRAAIVILFVTVSIPVAKSKLSTSVPGGIVAPLEKLTIVDPTTFPLFQNEVAPKPLGVTVMVLPATIPRLTSASPKFILNWALALELTL